MSDRCWHCLCSGIRAAGFSEKAIEALEVELAERKRESARLRHEFALEIFNSALPPTWPAE